MGLPAVFLDRDGVINRNRGDYVLSWAEFEFLPGSLEALRRLAGLGWPVVVVTNQSPIGRGLVSSRTIADINRRMMALVRDAGGRLDAVYSCPHWPEEGCECRKPRPGLLLMAARDLGLDLERSCLIGDGAGDIEAGLACGCRSLLVQTGRGVEELARLRERGVEGYEVVADLARAVECVLAWAAPPPPAALLQEHPAGSFSGVLPPLPAGVERG